MEISLAGLDDGRAAQVQGSRPEATTQPEARRPEHKRAVAMRDARRKRVLVHEDQGNALMRGRTFQGGTDGRGFRIDHRRGRDRPSASPPGVTAGVAMKRADREWWSAMPRSAVTRDKCR